MKLLLLVPLDMPRYNFDFFDDPHRYFLYLQCCVSVNYTGEACIAGIIDLKRNFLPVSTTPGSKIFFLLEFFTGVNNTSEEFLTCVNNTSKAVLHQCQ